MEDRFCFKVWDTEAGQFYSDESAEILKLHLRPDGHLGFFSGKTHIGGLVICMCTGLKDKNGKLIYEGDILRDFYNGHTGPVEWDADYAKFIVAHRKLVVWAFDEGYCTEAWEIIGTIYENPELLESQR